MIMCCVQLQEFETPDTKKRSDALCMKTYMNVRLNNQHKK